MLRRFAVLVSAALLVCGCTEVRQGVASPAGSTATTPAPSEETEPPAAPSPTDEQPPADPSSPADTEDDGGPAQEGADDDGSTMRVKGLRVSSDDGYTRLVVDLSSSGVPEWTVGYSTPSGPGGGPVDIAGDAFLRVRLKTQAESGGRSTSRVRVSPGPVAEALTTGSSGGYEEVLIGVRDGEKPFRAYALTDPGRIVIEVGGAG